VKMQARPQTMQLPIHIYHDAFAIFRLEQTDMLSKKLSKSAVQSGRVSHRVKSQT
jgi:hypothetical protein